MNFGQAIASCFRKYFIFSGRARRSEFWYWMLFTMGTSWILTYFMGRGLFANSDMSGYVVAVSIQLIFTLLTFIPSMAVSWRRLHDTGRSGWFYAAGLIGFFFGLGIMYGLMLMDDGFAGSGSGAHHDNGTVKFSTIAFLFFILVWSVTFIAFTCQDSEHGPNKYGPSSKYGGEDIFD